MNGPIDYYERVMELNPGGWDYSRFFLAPGVGHRGDGNGDGVDPSESVSDTEPQAWVENRTVQERSEANVVAK